MFGEAVEYLPILIRIAAVVVIAAALYDYFKRKWAEAIVEAIKNAGAESPETAVGTKELENSRRGISTKIRFLLNKEYSPLRRYVKCTTPERDEDENNKKRKKCSQKLTGEEKWYILPPAAPAEDTDEAASPSASIPAILRDGGAVSPAWLIFGCVLTVAFAELVIYFLPQIVSFFTSISKLGRK